MLKDVVLLVVGAVLGVVAASAWTWISASMRVRRSTAASNDRLRTDVGSPDRAVRYYREAGRVDELYAPQVLTQAGALAVSSDANWRRRLVDPTQDVTVTEPVLRTEIFPVDDKAIARLQRQGMRLWDGQILHVVGDTIDESGTRTITTGVGNYFGFVTRLEELRRTLKAAPSPRRAATLHRLLPPIADPLSKPLQPLVMSAAATCLFDTDQGAAVLISRRSDEVVSGLGRLCVAPTFGLESTWVGDSRSEFSVLFYNFAKEFVEEVFGVQRMEQAHASPEMERDRIFRGRHARMLLRQFDNGRAELKVNGLGLELTDGSLAFALSAHFHDPSFYQYVRDNAVGNWEWTSEAGPALRFIDAEPSQLTRDVNVNEMSATSVFSLDLALLHRSEAPV